MNFDFSVTYMTQYYICGIKMFKFDVQDLIVKKSMMGDG